MATVKLNALINDLSGTIGGIELFRRGDQIIARETSKHFLVATPARLANRQRFAEAAAYAKSVQADPGRAIPYLPKARAKLLAPYHMALNDFLNPPEVTEIDLTSIVAEPGCPIRIRAVDDFEVVRVKVAVQTVHRQLIEEGDAFHESGSGLWIYTTRTEFLSQQTIMVQATAADRPGHTGGKIGFWWVP